LVPALIALHSTREAPIQKKFKKNLKKNYFTKSIGQKYNFRQNNNNMQVTLDAN
jgi:hypothetical protein